MPQEPMQIPLQSMTSKGYSKTRQVDAGVVDFGGSTDCTEGTEYEMFVLATIKDTVKVRQAATVDAGDPKNIGNPCSVSFIRRSSSDVSDHCRSTEHQELAAPQLVAFEDHCADIGVCD